MLAPRLSFRASFGDSATGSTQQNRVIQIRPLCYRWVILAIFSLLNATNAILWITFAPIQSRAREYFNCGSNAINGLSILFLALYLPGSVLSTLMMQKYGLRGSIVLGAVFNASSGLVRYLSLFASHDSSLDLVILFVGQSIAAMGQPLFTNFPAVIAMEWFPVEQRDMATIIAAISNLIGNAAGQVIPPLLVPEGNLDSGLKQLLLGEFFLTAAGLLIAVLFVRERPHHLVPSKAMAKILNSGAVEHNGDVKDSGTDAKVGQHSNESWSVPLLPAGQQVVFGLEEVMRHWMALLRDAEFCKLMIGFGVGLGVFNSLMTEIEELVQTANYDSDDAGIFGAVLIGCGFLSCGIVGPIIDQTHRYGLFLRSGFVCSILVMTALLLLLRPGHLTQLLVAWGLLGFFMMPMLPVSLDAAAECTYPISAESSSGLLMTMGQLVGIPLIFVIDWLIKKSGNRKEGCDVSDTVTPLFIFMVSMMLIPVICIFSFKQTMKRLEVEDCSLAPPDSPNQSGFETDGFESAESPNHGDLESIHT